MSDDIVDNIAEAEKAVSTSIDDIFEKLPDCMKNLHANYEALLEAWENWQTNQAQRYRSEDGTEYTFGSSSFPFKLMTNTLAGAMGDITNSMAKMPRADSQLVASIGDQTDDIKNGLWETIKTANHYSAYEYMRIAWRRTNTYDWGCKRTLAGHLQPKPDITKPPARSETDSNEYYINQDGHHGDDNQIGDALSTHPSLWWEGPVQSLTAGDKDFIGGTDMFQTLYNGMIKGEWQAREEYTCSGPAAAAGVLPLSPLTTPPTERSTHVVAYYAAPIPCTWTSNVAAVTGMVHSRLALYHYFISRWMGMMLGSKGGEETTLDNWDYYTSETSDPLDTSHTLSSLAGLSMWENSSVLPAFSYGNFERPETIAFFTTKKWSMTLFSDITETHPTQPGRIAAGKNAFKDSGENVVLTNLKTGYEFTVMANNHIDANGAKPYSYWDHDGATVASLTESKFFGKTASTQSPESLDGTRGWTTGGEATTSPMDDLVYYYFELKKAFWALRESVGCIVNLDVAIMDAKTELGLIAEDTLENPRAPDAAKQAAREALAKLEQSKGDISSLSSSFNKNLLFREQCYLMAHLPSLASYHKNISAKGAMSVAEQNISSVMINVALTTEQLFAIEEAEGQDLALALSDLQGEGDGFIMDMVGGDIASAEWALEGYLGEGNLELLRDAYGVEIEAEYIGTTDATMEVETFDTKTQKKLPTPARNASILLDAKSPYGFMNALAVGPSQKHLHNLTVAEISALQPMISLYKIEFDPYTREEVAIKMTFDSFAGASNPVGVETLLQNKDKRGFGTGIQSFNFTYAGSNPFAVKKSIKATLKIFSNSFDELLQPRGPYRYVDLALKTSNNSTDSFCDDKDLSAQNENMAKLNFRLRAIVGWQEAPGNDRVLSGQSRRAINDSFVTLNLVPTVHDFEFDETGRVTFTINYLAYIDEFMDQNEFDIFSMNHDVKISQIERGMSYKKLKKECKKEKIKLLKEKNISAIDDEKKKSISALIQGMVQQSSIYYINQDYEQIRNFAAAGPFFSTSDTIIPLTNEELNSTLAESVASAVDRYSSVNSEDSLDEVRTGLMAVDPNQVSVAYFYVSDLLDYILGELSVSLRQIGEKLSEKVGITPEDTEQVIEDAKEMLEFAGSNLEDRLARDKIKFERHPEYDGFLEVEDLDAEKSEIEKLEEELAILETKPGAAEHAAAQRLATRNVGVDTTFELCDMIAEITKYERLAAEFKKFRLVLGPVEIFDVRNDIVSKTINIGDFPISVKYFVEFLTEKLAKKQETIYSISNFCNDFFNNLIRNFLNDDTCFSGINSSLKVSVNAAVITSYNESGEKGGPDEITARANAVGLRRFGINDISNGNRRILNISGQRQSDAQGGFPFEHNYLMFFAARTKPTADMHGKKTDDHAKGIMHYELGRERGIVKNIKLTKTQTPGLQEVRFEQDGYDGLRQLRVVYDVNIDTYADVHAYPGTYLFVNPLTFAPMSNLTPCDPMNLTEYGIGGYYMVVTSEHEFAPGSANTKIYAKWVNEITGTGPNCSETKGGKLARKCTSRSDPMKEG